MFVIMAMVSEIKCARCDRKYSGVRSRCPYCGARRIGPGKYSGDDKDNVKGKMLISVLILAVFTVAAGILLFTTPNNAEAQDPNNDPLLASPEDDIESERGLHPEPTEPPTPTPDPEPPQLQLEVTSIRIMYDGRVMTDFSQPRGVPIEMYVSLEPPGIEDMVTIEWESTDTEIFEVTPVDVNGRGVKIMGIVNGYARLVVKAGGMEASSDVYIVNP